jgi:two-component system sensor histidine kinase BaeS
VRSLRLRFFLISWPLVVAAIGTVAVTIDRVSLQLNELRIGAGSDARPEEAAAWAQTLGNGWVEADLPARLRELASHAATPVDLVVLAPDGVEIAATTAAVSARSPDPGSGGATRLVRREERPTGVSDSEFLLVGLPVRSASGTLLGRLFVLPAPHEPLPPSASPAIRQHLRRTLWITAIAASVAAAAAAFLLAGPLARRVRLLTDASAAIANGSLDVRVDVSGHDELARLARSFNAMAQKLQHAEAHKRNLVTDVAHELRTPLTNIIGLVESMQDGLRPASAGTLASLRDEAGVLAERVDELQELSLAESGQIVFHIEAIDAVAAAQAEVDAILPRAGGVTVRGPEAAAPVRVLADARRLSQVLRNLLQNALTHTPAGGKVALRVASADGRVTIEVADTGRGIPREHLALVFDRFHRVDPSRDRSSGGMGIGLALVRQLVHAMNGEVDVDSEVGRGSRFRVVLPGTGAINPP